MSDTELLNNLVIPRLEFLLEYASTTPRMTLRQWYAGQALAGMAIAYDYKTGPCNAAIVERVFIIADMMIAAEQGEKEPEHE